MINRSTRYRARGSNAERGIHTLTNGLGTGMSCGCCRQPVKMDADGRLLWPCSCQAAEGRCILCRRCPDHCKCAQRRRRA